MVNQLIFNATVINCYTENDVLTIGIGDDDVEPENYVIISRLDEKGQSIDDSIGIQTSESDREYSNAIKSVNVKNNEIEIFISEDKADKIGISVLKINIDSNNVNLDLFFKYLSNILDGSSVHLDVSL